MAAIRMKTVSHFFRIAVSELYGVALLTVKQDDATLISYLFLDRTRATGRRLWREDNSKQQTKTSNEKRIVVFAGVAR